MDRWTSREPVDVVNSHVNAVVPDTMKWEQSAAYYIDSHPLTDAFVKNFGLEFAIPYFHNGQPHDYMPDFIVRLKTDPVVHLILETKGYDPVEQVKSEAAQAVGERGERGRDVWQVGVPDCAEAGGGAAGYRRVWVMWGAGMRPNTRDAAGWEYAPQA